jgi:hypothetical protein
MSSFDDAPDPDPGAGSGTGTDSRSTEQPSARVIESEFDIEPLRACRRLRPHRSLLDTPLSVP